jgi:pantoate--beta-alanine ligase
MVDDLNMDLNVVVMDTVREEDGLAMSSRNAYLTPSERAAAPIIYQSLCAARNLHQQYHNGQHPQDSSRPTISASQLKQVVDDMLRTEPFVKEVQYVSIDSKETMQPLQEVGPEGAVISLACKVGSVRLIDNIVL